MYEYAISRGEGTLVDYGVFASYGILDLLEGDLLIIQECSPNCVTGV
jgi:hypothetical protein